MPKGKVHRDYALLRSLFQTYSSSVFAIYASFLIPRRISGDISRSAALCVVDPHGVLVMEHNGCQGGGNRLPSGAILTVKLNTIEQETGVVSKLAWFPGAFVSLRSRLVRQFTITLSGFNDSSVLSVLISVRNQLEKSPLGLNLSLVVLALLSIVPTIFVRRLSSRKLPPAPPEWPLIGHLHLLGTHAHQSMAELAAK
ncbi:uncharacterized protein [Physcomitrium patens]|uniref:uncharacterized protein n=1 Tax=Physcomitrium patens TaxID=3218 RepID=UPI003CCE0127